MGKLCWLLVPAQTSIHVNPKIGVKRGTRKELRGDESQLLSLMFKSELFDNICTEIIKSLFQVKKKNVGGGTGCDPGQTRMSNPQFKVQRLNEVRGSS